MSILRNHVKKYNEAYYLELAQDAFVCSVSVADSARVVCRQLTEVHQLTEDWDVENILVQVEILNVDN